ncbi:MAG: hypothetical protein KDD51_03910 [Bdellovibrionales bacterium]|nr:hypothetical protein [Bdellovibrionales bacterium]
MSKSFQNVVRAALVEGYESPLVFVERTTHSRLELIEKRLDAHFETQVGTCFEASCNGSRRRTLLGEEDPVRLAKALGLKITLEAHEPPVLQHTATKTLQIFSRFLKEKYRSVAQQFPELRHWQLSVEFWHRQTSVHDAEGIEKLGGEQSASAFVRYLNEQNQPVLLATHELGEGVLFKKLRDGRWIEKTLALRLRPHTRSEAPREKLPVVFSENAVAKLCEHFLADFHADRVLLGRSFLNRSHLPLPLKFSVLESPIEGDWDHEGNPRRAVTLLDRGQPRALFANSEHATLLEIPRSGHGRRAHYRSLPNIGFWSPEIIGHAASDNLLTRHPKTVLVEDLEWDGETLSITESFLVRDGQIGESLVPFFSPWAPMELLSRFECFSRRTKAHIRREAGSPWVTQIRTPAALAGDLDLFGVPR